MVDFTKSTTIYEAQPTNLRSAADIVCSCLTTILACSWVSVHPNIPSPDDSWWTIGKQRLKIMFWALIAPELVLIWAMRQYYGAKRISEQFSEQGWTTFHGHFLQMGGFLLCRNEIILQTLESENLYTLLQEGVIEFPHVSKEEIMDRGKSDALSKSFVIIQTSWFIVQCLTRHIQHLLITQLELATLALAVLNGVMYFFWWNKPLDVRTPIHIQLINNSASETQATTQRTSSRTMSPSTFSSTFSRPSASVQNQPTHFASHSSSPERSRLVRHILTGEVVWSLVHFLSSIPTSDAILASIRTGVVFLKNSLTNLKKRLQTISTHIFVTCPFQRMILAPIGGMTGATGFFVSSKKVPTFYALHANILGKSVLQTVVYITLGCAGLLGAIHCIAWNWEFPTLFEKQLWRTCSTIFVLLPLATLITDSVGKTSPPNTCLPMRYTYVARLVWRCVLAMCYIVVRLCLLIQAIICMRSLPASAYATVQWSKFLPQP
ncbi:hypothetical protein BU17DRAFT_44502 [Hysterangium stoloniferum]|nr:hypothetical protein BU17DRAFT_44502 [Hysterangium stoloniferum]